MWCRHDPILSPTAPKVSGEGGQPHAHVFGHTALGTTQVNTDGQRTSYTRDPKGTLITQKAADGTRYNLITDYQGSVLALLGTNGELAATYTYSPYGTVNAQGPAAGKNHFRWIGTYQLHRGLNLTGHRYYNPTWGRFTQPDPSGQETNPYTYAQCDPVNLSDPTGAAPNACDIVVYAATVVIGVAATVATGGLAAFFEGVVLGVGLGGLLTCENGLLMPQRRKGSHPGSPPRTLAGKISFSVMIILALVTLFTGAIEILAISMALVISFAILLVGITATIYFDTRKNN
ncbi:RHS repeat-associated protein [Amycolatopsis arida]|nr:RHS repeat-associated protein [Amycolatopsis arida]